MNLHEESIGFLVNSTGRRMAQLLTTLYSPYEVTTEQWSLLRALETAGNMNQKELAQRVGKDQASVTRILDGMERKQLVRREPNAQDRRSYVIHVTDKGRAMTATLLPIEEEMLRIALEGLTESELQQLKAVLGRITENVTQALIGGTTK